MSDWLGGRLAQLREYPRHIVLGALVAGLLAMPLAPTYVVLVALAAAALAGRPLIALLAVTAVLAGAIGAQARLAALDRTVLPPYFGSTVVADAVLLEQPRPVQYGATALAQLRAVAPSGRPLLPAADGERVMLRLLSRTVWPAVATGRVVRVTGRLRALGPFEQHYARKGAHAAISLDTAAATGQHRGGPWRLVDVIRGRAEQALSAGLARPQAALLRGMVLGQDEALDEATRDEFQAAGLSHVLAASGQNVALLLALALPVLAFAGLGWRRRLAVALGLIALYVPLAGAGPSIQRAGVMGAATTAAALAGRAPSRWYALLLAAAVTLLLNPRAAADPGWQLSFAAVVAIALATPAISERLRRRRVPAPVADAAAMSLAATLGTAPLIAYDFAQFSLVSLAANMLAAPAIAPLMWLGMIAAALGQLAAPLAIPLNTLNGYLLGYVGAVAHTSAGVPHASIAVAIPGLTALIAIYAALALGIALLRRNSRAT
ncbi:MAG TPA: ComEC/Rec2 family competence protein [Conexibacter sp.]|jgi:competence protein ComEC